MSDILDWNSNREMWIRVLKKQTGKDLLYWNEQISKSNVQDEQGLRNLLTDFGISGYAANLLVMERFGYPDWIIASADELVEAQYADRTHLRPIYDAILEAISTFGEFTIQTRKSYVSLLTTRRTFARVRPSTKNRVDVGLRLEDPMESSRLKPCNMQKTMQVQIGFSSVEEVDTEAIHFLRAAYVENS